MAEFVVTGATGFVGRHLVSVLKERHFPVLPVVRSREKGELLHQENFLLFNEMTGRKLRDLGFAHSSLVHLIGPSDDESECSIWDSIVPTTEALLATAKQQAEAGSWENIHLARVYYLSGKKDEAESIIKSVLLKDSKAGEWIRIGRIYYQAGEWDKARESFENVINLAPKDEDWLAEIGAYYNLQGGREKAEELFGRSIERGSHLKNTLAIAGSYIGVEPRQQ